MAQIAGSAQSNNIQPKTGLTALIAALIFATALATLLLVPDTIRRNPMDQDGTPLAVLVSSRNEVRQKNAGTIVWGTPGTGSELFKKDSIATMSDSRASISFHDGSEIELEPESMIVLEEAPHPEKGGGVSGRIVARLIRGSVIRKKSGKTPLFISTSATDSTDGKNLIRIDEKGANSVFRVVKRSNGLEVIVESGTVHVGSREIASGEKAVVSAGEISIKRRSSPLPAPRLKQPRIRIERMMGPGALLDRVIEVFGITQAMAAETDSFGTSDSEDIEVVVHFSWETIQGAKGYRIQLSNDPAFEELLVDRKLDATNFEYRFESESIRTESFFRVAALNADGEAGEFSPVERVQIRPDPGHESPRTKVAKKTPKAEPTKAPVAKTAPVPTQVAKAKTQTTKKSTPLPVPTPSEAPPTVAVEKPRVVAPAPPAAPAVHAAPVTQTRALVVPVRWHSHLEAALGATLMSRDFHNSVYPERAGGTGLTPGRLSTELLLTRDEKSWGRLAATFLLQRATPQADALSDTHLAVPLFTVSVQKLWNARQATLGTGLVVASSQKLAWNDATLTSSQSYLGGLSLQASSLLDRPSSWRWDAVLNAYLLTDRGADLGLSLASPIFTKTRDVSWTTYRGWLLRGSTQARWIARERFWAFSFEGGYAL